MWADTLLALERGHLLRLALWGGASVLAGSLIVAWLAVRRVDAALLRHFAIQTAAWGVIDLAICAWSRQGIILGQPAETSPGFKSACGADHAWP